jgi:hypothetical protein
MRRQWGELSTESATKPPGIALVSHQTRGVPAMTNSRVHASIALGGVLIVGAYVAFVPPIPPASAQSQAQRICREQGISPKSDGYEYCLSQATRALYWGEPELARTFARVAATAREACLGYGLQPQTTGFQACIDRETYARGLMVHADSAPEYGPQIADPQ